MGQPLESAMHRDNSELRLAAWDAFQRDDFDAAIDAFLEMREVGDLRSTDLMALVELLVDRERGEWASALIDEQLAHWDAIDAPEAAAPWRALQFDLQMRAAAYPDAVAQRGVILLESLAATNDAAEWDRILTLDRREQIEASFDTPVERLQAFELEALAPASTGLPTRAAALIEEIGALHASQPAVARTAERLLHALGEAAAAYRVERVRRMADSDASLADRPSDDQLDLDIRGWTIVIAGGHAGLRSIIARDLLRSGAARIDAIPSATEASRAGRDVQAALAGADAVVVLVRQIAHSTSDQVKRAAKRAGVPLVIADSAGISGVRRALASLTALQPDPTLDI